jgi:cysteinyl-tRNA synthetase
MDLIFPHHENEIAQSCGATGKEFARYWIHNGFVQINKEKMSKSLGNFFTIREIFEKSKCKQEVTGEILRYFLLSTHYHGPLDFSDQALNEAKNTLNGFYDLLVKRLAENGQSSTADRELEGAIERCRLAFQAAMDDDFNTPGALAAFQGLKTDVNKLLSQGLSTEARQVARQAFRKIGELLGLFQLDEWQFNTPFVEIPPSVEMSVDSGMTPRAKERHPAYGTHVYDVSVPLNEEADENIKRKLDERNEARKKKDFKRADEIRAELAALGIIIEDKPDGTSRWKR